MLGWVGGWVDGWGGGGRVGRQVGEGGGVHAALGGHAPPPWWRRREADAPSHPSSLPPAVEGEFLACGSETNELFVYHKALSGPIARRSFAAQACDGGGGGGGDDDGGLSGDDLDPTDRSFISAVCWRPGSQTLLAANSAGTIKVFQLGGERGASA